MKTKRHILETLSMLLALCFAFALVLRNGGTASGYPAGPTPTPSNPQGLVPRAYLPLVMKMPPVTTSHYMNQVYSDYNSNSLGQTDAQQNFGNIQAGNRTVIILDYGDTCQTPGGAQGALSFTKTCKSTSQIEPDVKSYIDGYCTYMQTTAGGTACGTQYQSIPPRAVVILVGTSNAGTNVTYAHGQAWANMVIDLNQYLMTKTVDYQLQVKGASDIELQLNSAASSKAWVDGYDSVASVSFNYFNFGNCVCSEGYNPGYGLPSDWHYEDVWYVSWGATGGFPTPFPEIYNTTGAQAREWQGLSHYAVVAHGSQILFQNILTQLGACNQPGESCPGTNDSPGDAFTQMYIALNADPLTQGGLDTGSQFRQSDISWYPRP